MKLSEWRRLNPWASIHKEDWTLAKQPLKFHLSKLGTSKSVQSKSWLRQLQGDANQESRDKKVKLMSLIWMMNFATNFIPRIVEHQPQEDGEAQKRYYICWHSVSSTFFQMKVRWEGIGGSITTTPKMIRQVINNFYKNFVKRAWLWSYMKAYYS